jgi:hypothetical protein
MTPMPFKSMYAYYEGDLIVLWIPILNILTLNLTYTIEKICNTYV